jgi:hypothetical protein
MIVDDSTPTLTTDEAVSLIRQEYAHAVSGHPAFRSDREAFDVIDEQVAKLRWAVRRAPALTRDAVCAVGAANVRFLTDIAGLMLDEALARVREEHARAVAKHPAPFRSDREGFDILVEEHDELKRAVRHGDGDPRAEAVQTAAMAVRFLADCSPS